MKNKKQLILVAAAAVLAVAAIAAALGIGKDAQEAAVQVVRAGETLSIPLGGVTDAASFYPLEVDGTEMEVLAIRDQAGNVRTAFNTCQSCYSSGHGYYVAEGTELICQNCGFHFTAEQVEVPGGGCNPYPIFEENKTVTDGSIEISYDFLKASAGIFAHWSKLS
jgi:uncharacterized membrane protein